VLDKLFRPYRARIHVAMELPSIGHESSASWPPMPALHHQREFAKDYVRPRSQLLTVEGVDLWRELGLIYPPRPQPPRAAQALIRHDPRTPRKAAEPAEQPRQLAPPSPR